MKPSATVVAGRIRTYLPRYPFVSIVRSCSTCSVGGGILRVTVGGGVEGGARAGEGITADVVEGGGSVGVGGRGGSVATTGGGGGGGSVATTGGGEVTVEGIIEDVVEGTIEGVIEGVIAGTVEGTIEATVGAEGVDITVSGSIEAVEISEAKLPPICSPPRCIPGICVPGSCVPSRVKGVTRNLPTLGSRPIALIAKDLAAIALDAI